MIEGAAQVASEEGKAPEVEIMISQVASAGELQKAREIVEQTAQEELKKLGKKISYKIGTMIETPRAALTAAELAQVADFFSFGTNDLTQATFAFSRDDVEAKFMPFYLENKILPSNPFETLDVSGVGRLVKMASEEAKQVNSKLRIGVCGEHGGDPDSIMFFHNTKVDYVSCSPYRVPVARLVAAQAALKGKAQASTTA